MKTRIVRVISALILSTIFIGAASQRGIASASTLTAALERDTAQPSGPIEPQELVAFLDGLLAAEMAEKHIPGAMVAVVENGSVLLAKGYGFADLEERAPVDPERTLFRVASVSKLFTWTAVMQLVEQGKLSLDTDVNEYLDFAIPTTYPEPVTLRHLLSHTPGFEDKALGNYRLKAELMIPLDDWLKANLPARVFPPGEVIAYSNYGAALAGYIVERVSGFPFNECVEKNIFTQLGMAHSTFRQPLPETLAPDMATGYHYTNEYIAGSFIFDLPFPAGALSSTANDMARFMIAHLANGELDVQRILQEETAIQMHSQLYTPDPRLNGGMAHGFFENTVNGQRVIWHGGSLVTFRSGLYLIPEQHVGLFISTNSTGGSSAISTIIEAFIDHYYPEAESPAPKPAPGFAERIAPYLGEYADARGNFTSFEKFNRLTTPFNVSLGNDNTLVISGLRFAEVEPGLLQDIDNPANRMVYRNGSDGHLFLTGVKGAKGDPFTLFRTPWYGNTNLHLLLFVTGALLFLGVLIAWPAGYFTGRRKRPAAFQTTPLPARLARWTAALFGLLLLVLLLGFVSLFTDVLPGFGETRMFLETVPMLNVLLSLSYVLGGLAMAILVSTVLSWVRRYWSLRGRIFYTLLALLALLLTWWLLYWNLFP